MSDKRLKALEEEIAYLRKSIDELKEIRTVEVHTHYHYDYSGMNAKFIKGDSEDEFEE